MSKLMKVLLVVIGVMLILYVGTYSALSSGGRYEPMVLGLDHVKWSSWIPAGFLRNSNKQEFNLPAIYTFYPLWILDRWYWHKDVQGPPPES